MIVRNVSRGRSFQKLAAYLTSPKEGQHRALWSSVENVASENPKTAAKIMAYIAEGADEIKAAQGVKATGRKSKDGPVYHVVMSWAEGQQPEQAHQLQAARDLLQSIGLEKAQALIVAHNDNGKEHLHIMVNLVDPETGKRFALSNDRHKMQEFALAYERANGGIIIERRADNAESWAKGEAQQKGESIPRADMDKADRAQRKAWAQIKAERDALYSAQSAERATMRAEHGDQWKQAKAEAAQHRAAYKAAFRAAYAEQKAAAKVQNKPLWADVFKRQKAERASIERATLDARQNAESARRLVAKRTKAAQKAEKRSRSLIGRAAQRLGFTLSPAQALHQQQTAAALMERAALELARVELQKAQLSAKQEAERRAIGKQISADTFAKAQLAVDTMPRADFAAMIRAQDDQRRQMIERQNAERAALGMKPYAPRPQGAATVTDYQMNPDKADFARARFERAADRRQEKPQAERPTVQAAGPQFTPAGTSKGNTPAAPDQAAQARADQVKQAEQERTRFKPQELQARRDGDKAPAFEQAQGERKASPLDKARERNNTAEAKAERQAQRAFNRARQRDDFER